jgi:uncharacterized protein (DUF924 family)
MSHLPEPAHAVLDFWFGPLDDPSHRLSKPQWFKKDDAFDADIRARFGPLIEQALSGKLDAAWVTRPVQALPALALVIVLDQFTRNTFRGTARAFAGDARALQVARALVASGADRELTGVQRQFCYLPFEHAEDRSHQRTAVQLFEQLERDEPALGGPTGLAHWARQHEDIVLQFGRFPHRNAALGRASTPEEAAFLLTPGSGF